MSCQFDDSELEHIRFRLSLHYPTSVSIRTQSQPNAAVFWHSDGLNYVIHKHETAHFSYLVYRTPKQQIESQDGFSDINTCLDSAMKPAL